MAGLAKSRFDLTKQEMAELVRGEPSYRVGQLWEAIHRGLDPEELTSLPRRLRQRLGLEESLRKALRLEAVVAADGGWTQKLIFGLRDGDQIEAVLMHYPNRTTICVSSQAGCAMGCVFCATGQGGFRRHLSTGEIIEQVVEGRRIAASLGWRRLGQVVFMGMGEPLANYERVWGAVVRLHEEFGISSRHITVSTVGLVPGIRRLAAEPLPVRLAVSLHAANDELRGQLVPMNQRWPLRSLAEACQDYVARGKRRLSLEWALMAGVNDSSRDANELAAFARPLKAHVNLIPLNPTPGWHGRPSSGFAVERFASKLKEAGVVVSVRRTRGLEAEAACGQLRSMWRGRRSDQQGYVVRRREDAVSQVVQSRPSSNPPGGHGSVLSERVDLSGGPVGGRCSGAGDIDLWLLGERV